MRIAAFCTWFAMSSGLLWVSYTMLCRYHEFLESYHVHGLFDCWVLAMALAMLVTPGFAAGMTTSPDDQPKTFKEAVTLYFVVSGITFAALSVVFLLLWIAGWTMVLIEYSFLRFKTWLLS